MKSALFKLWIFFVALLCFANVSFAQTNGETGIAFYEKGEYEKAAETLEKAVEENEKNYDARLYLGAALYRLKKTEKAVEAFRKVRAMTRPEDNSGRQRFKFISKPRVGYTTEARNNGVQGTIALAVEFGANGEINFVVPLNELADGLTENTVRVVRGIKFEPATKDGKPVTMIGFLEYSFSIF